MSRRGGAAESGSAPSSTKKAAGSPAAAPAAADGDDDRGVIRIGKVRIHLGRIPELVLLICFPLYVTKELVQALELSWPIAFPAGLFVARQVQRLLAWMQGEGGSDGKKC
mmetsp:Transcript_98540/g.277077  ORF Transcript_98540/g.277077 Transcript_98540/m.277077 type:complete len:110 (-) Transcript_98540:53-382(-)